MGDHTCVSLRGSDVTPEVFHCWFKDRFTHWAQAGWNPRIQSEPAQLVSGEWCVVIELDGIISVKKLNECGLKSIPPSNDNYTLIRRNIKTGSIK